MNIFETLVIQPIFNLLALIYGIVPGGDFGITIIIFTLIVRLLLWPLIKKQLHQTKMMRKLQPELKKIKKKSKGNKMLESQMMMELYKENGVNPFGSIGVMLLQLPILISLYIVIRLIVTDKDNIAKFTYDFLEHLPRLQDVINHHDHFREHLFGVINLTQHAFANGIIYWPIVIMALVAAVLQYIQSKQIAPQVTEKRRLRDMLKEQAAGKEVDQAEVTAQFTQNMLIVFPVLTFVVCMYIPGALVLYYAVSSAIAVIQQKIILDRDEQELEAIADKKPRKKPTHTSTTSRVKNATEAEVVATKKKNRSTSNAKKHRTKR